MSSTVASSEESRRSPKPKKNGQSFWARAFRHGATASPWIFLGLGLILPWGAIISSEELAVPLWLLLTSLLMFSIAGALLYIFRRANVVIARAQDFLSEILRAPFLLLTGLIVGGVFSTIVMIVSVGLAAFTSSYIEPKFDDRATLQRELDATAQDIERPASDAATSVPSASEPEPVPFLQLTFPWREQYPAAFGALLSGFATMLVIGVFYRRLAPYTDLWELIGEIQHDIRRAQEANNGHLTIWWCFPGFGLGRYRSLDENGEESYESARYRPFSGALATLITDPSVHINAILYDENCLNAFYASYHHQMVSPTSTPTPSGDLDQDAVAWATLIEPHLSDPKVMAAVNAEDFFATTAKNATKAGANNRIYRAKQPDALPASVIVIGNVVYQIATFGSPIYVSSRAGLNSPFSEIEGLFVPASKGGRDHLLNLVAFRRDDHTFAQVVAEHLQQHISSAESAKLFE